MVNRVYQEETWEEVLDGGIVAMSPRPSINHNIVAENIVSIFKQFLKGKQCRAFGEVDVYLTDKDRVIPDAMIVCNKDIIKSKGIQGAPDLVVEILSPSTAANDKGYKKSLYEKCGVKEYWIVTVESQSIDVYVLENGRFELSNVYSVFPDYLMEKMTPEEKTRVVHKFSTTILSDLTIVLDDVFDGLI